MDTLHIEDFQSLRQVDVQLGRFTVITGASSSGKSAFMRALKTLASNSRGTAYISHGAKRARISATIEDTSVLLERGGREDGYHVKVGASASPSDADRSWTKLGGTVPEEITKLLGIPPVGTEGNLHYAGQFDRPYLVDEGGAAVARVLGALTNVDIVFAAAREANRLRLEAGTTLKTRQGDLARLIEQAQGFGTLAPRTAACDEAEQHLLVAEQAQAKRIRLATLAQELAQATTRVQQTAVPAAAALPDVAPAREAQERLGRFLSIVTAISNTRRQAAQAAERAQAATEQAEAAQTELHAILTEAGTCPTCGSDTKELDRVRAA